jgi:hypothetical protein
LGSRTRNIWGHFESGTIQREGFSMKRAVLYLRVSTIDQTTANQERELRISRPFDVAINESIRLAERARALRH